jgi:hypothetical protein
MRRFSIRKLMGFVVIIAVAFASLRGANAYWAGGLVLAFLGLLGYSILASIHRQAAARAAWLGFIVAGGGYFLAVRALPDQERGWLPTAQLLSYIEQQVVGMNTFAVGLTSAAFVNTTSQAPSPYSATTPTLTTLPGAPAPTAWDVVVYPYPNGATNYIRSWNPQGATPTAWAPFLPGAANGEAFKSIGHSLFALMAGWIGAVVSRRMFEHRSALVESGESSVASEHPSML